MGLKIQGRRFPRLPYNRNLVKRLLFLLLVLGACVRETEVDLADYYAEKPVIYGIISPGEHIYVHVSKTLPFGFPADSIKAVDNALVELSGNGAAVVLTFDPKKKVYFASREEFPLKKGETYRLKVVLPDGAVAFASARLPEKEPRWAGINYNLVERNLDSDELFTLIEFNFYWFNDGEADCDYLVYSEAIIRGPANAGIGNNYVFPDENTAGPVLRAYYLDLYSEIAPVSKAKVSLVKAASGIQQFNRYEVRLMEIRDKLDMNLFWELYRGVIPEYTNIEGGFGFFGGYIKTDTTITIDQFLPVKP